MNIALTIAGSDAGIQADLKTFHQFGVFGTSVITAVTAQNTRGVSAVHTVPIEIVEKQMAALAEDLPPMATKTGMLGTGPIVCAVANGIRKFGFRICVVDPVMVSSSGHRLLTAEAEALIVRDLLPQATLITPNAEEAEILTGLSVRNANDQERSAARLVELGAGAALVKGGHVPGKIMVDVLVTRTATRRFTHPRLDTRSTHGTGCTLSAAITAGLASGSGLEESVEQALDFVHRAIAAAPRVGSGHGPLSHSVPPVSGRD